MSGMLKKACPFPGTTKNLQIFSLLFCCNLHCIFPTVLLLFCYMFLIVCYYVYYVMPVFTCCQYSFMQLQHTVLSYTIRYKTSALDMTIMQWVEVVDVIIDRGDD